MYDRLIEAAIGLLILLLGLLLYFYAAAVLVEIFVLPVLRGWGL